MMTRALSSVTAGLAMTTTLLYVMQLLIDTGEDILTEPPVRIMFDWIDPIDPPDTPIQPVPPKKIDRPQPPPPLARTEISAAENGGYHLPPAPPLVPPVGGGLSGFTLTDNSLVNIYKVYPTYPATAEARGLEGTVLVQFDVTAVGSVANVTVLESSNPIFNKAAMRAAYKFRYKPRVVDGVPYGSDGLQQLFTFHMKN